MLHRSRAISRAAKQGLLICGLAGPLYACAADGRIDLLGQGGGHATTTSSGSGSGSASASTGTSSTGGTGGGCPGTMSLCGTTCVDEQSDPGHCGDCAKGCSHYQYCQGGQCYCEPGMSLCNGGCVDFASNPDHCGGCNHPCGFGEKCENMACSTGACSATLTGCAYANQRTACVDLANGYPFCGACDVVCAPTEVCAQNHCRAYAPAAPCTSCPCQPTCDGLVGPPSACCPGLYGGVTPICVSSVCP